jgi:hypothetical protein
LDGSEPDLHMRDVEILLRGFAMLLEGAQYGSSMAKFLNRFSKSAKAYTAETVERLERLFNSFLEATLELPPRAFYSQTGKFSVTTFEAVFATLGVKAGADGALPAISLSAAKLSALRADPDFAKFSQSQSNRKANVAGRLDRARALLTETV